MSKRAEQRAMEAYPINIKECLHNDGLYYEDDIHEDFRIGFIQGYEQAEKDFGLTWEDVQLLDFYAMKCQIEELEGRKFNSSQEFFEEVLRRFKITKEK